MNWQNMAVVVKVQTPPIAAPPAQEHQAEIQAHNLYAAKMAHLLEQIEHERDKPPELTTK